MHVLVAGSGWLGTAAARFLLARGDRVTAVVRTLQHAVRLRQEGIDGLCRDLSVPGATGDLPGDVDAILATQAAAGTGVDAYRRAYLDVTGELLSSAMRAGVPVMVVTSSTGVFCQSDGSTVDESTPVAPRGETASVLCEAERLVLSATSDRLRTCLVRPSGLYGPGRTGLIERVRSGALALGPGDETWMNFCHRDDAVAVLVAALDRGRGGAIYHATDREPALRKDVILWIAKRLKMTAPRREQVADEPASVRANRKVLGEASRAELGVQLAFPNFRKGLAPQTVELRT
jgi:nucleoside-diphosphate-sugar epimerase